MLTIVCLGDLWVHKASIMLLQQSNLRNNKPEMVNAPEGLNKVILRKIKRFDCKTNQVSSS